MGAARAPPGYAYVHFYVILVNYRPKIADMLTVIFTLNRDWLFQKIEWYKVKLNKQLQKYSFVRVELTSPGQTKEWTIDALNGRPCGRAMTSDNQFLQRIITHFTFGQIRAF